MNQKHHFTEEQLDNMQRACRGKRFAIVAARFHNEISEKLVDGARRALIASGVTEDAIDVYDVPGAFELPLAARTLVLRRVRDTRFTDRNGRFDRNGRYGAKSAKTPPRAYAGVIAVGAVIRGETPHFDFVATECARGIMNVQLETGAPIGFGVLTTETIEQAEKRAAADGGDKGYDAALAVASLLALRYSEAIKHAKTHTLNGHAHIELAEDEDERVADEQTEIIEITEEARVEIGSDLEPTASEVELEVALVTVEPVAVVDIAPDAEQLSSRSTTGSGHVAQHTMCDQSDLELADGERNGGSEETFSAVDQAQPVPHKEPALDAADELVDHFQQKEPEEQGDIRLSSDAPEENREVQIVEDKTLTCKDCSKEFIFTADEQQFFADKGFQNDPQRCRECRQTRRNSNNRNAAQRPSFETVCAECGVTTTVPFTPRGDRPVYCRTCYAKHTPEPTTA